MKTLIFFLAVVCTFAYSGKRKQENPTQRLDGLGISKNIDNPSHGSLKNIPAVIKMMTIHFAKPESLVNNKTPKIYKCDEPDYACTTSGNLKTHKLRTAGHTTDLGSR